MKYIFPFNCYLTCLIIKLIFTKGRFNSYTLSIWVKSITWLTYLTFSNRISCVTFALFYSIIRARFYTFCKIKFISLSIKIIVIMYAKFTPIQISSCSCTVLYFSTRVYGYRSIVSRCYGLRRSVTWFTGKASNFFSPPCTYISRNISITVCI